MLRRSFCQPLDLGDGARTCCRGPAISQGGNTWDVKAGYDLFETVSADTNFPGLGNLMGVPLETFNFGFRRNWSRAKPDTIVQRLFDVDVPTVAGSHGNDCSRDASTPARDRHSGQLHGPRTLQLLRDALNHKCKHGAAQHHVRQQRRWHLHIVPRCLLRHPEGES